MMRKNKNIKNLNYAELEDAIKSKKLGRFKLNGVHVHVYIPGESTAARVKRLYETRLANGKCQYCGRRKPIKGLKICKVCSDTRKQRQLELHGR